MELCSNYENCNTCLSQNTTIDASNTQVVQHFDGSGSSLTSNFDYERIYRPNGSLARTLYLKYLQDEKLQRMDKRQWYQCGELAEHAQRTFQEQSVDEETAHFLQQASHKSDWVFTQLWHSLARSILSIFMSQTSINGLVIRARNHILNASSAALPEKESDSPGSGSKRRRSGNVSPASSCILN
ncbi:protein-L-histidine N-pros-methyltransferase-like [Schistocerca serialis cubense]|uniref:protein-L-histidine N-pros-methyltransferase-like n=2 Tax=Schistocerca TaxID=7008 RepID=UPI00214F52F2|nr:protein-L-histidine N-pros-methyltransferase-like [Schistocerca serialis cubense]